jgi:TetR/AcrR family acrAB operon transcriptional repressor
MARKTKEDAEKTRQQLIDAARACFLQHGVAGTTLDMVARHAGMTRGAVYWHFANKAELFEAVRDEVAVPLFDPCAEDEFSLCAEHPLQALERFLTRIVDRLFFDQKAAEVLSILLFKCEYVGDFEVSYQAQKKRSELLIEQFTARYTEAVKAGVISSNYNPQVLGVETHLFLVGITRLIISRTAPLDQHAVALGLVKQHLARLS